MDASPVLAVNVESVDSSNEPVLGRVQAEQRKDPELCKLIEYLEKAELPEDSKEATWIATKANQNHFMVNGVLYFEPADSQGKRRLVVPQHLRRAVLDEAHDPVYAGHFSAKKLLQKVRALYYWTGMRGDAYEKCSSCVTCASTQGQGRRTKPPLHSILVSGPFDCIGMDYKEMDLSKSGNCYALVF